MAVVADDYADDDYPDFLCSCIVKTLAGNASVTVPLNVGATITDCKQYLSEIPETCYVTHYVLRHQGVEVNDFTEISSLLQVHGFSSIICI